MRKQISSQGIAEPDDSSTAAAADNSLTTNAFRWAHNSDEVLRRFGIELQFHRCTCFRNSGIFADSKIRAQSVFGNSFLGGIFEQLKGLL